MKTAIVLCASLLLAGCAGSQDASTAQDGSNAENDLRKYEGEFTPSDHDADSSVSAPGTQTGQRADGEPLSDQPSENPDQELVQGFRVQIYSTPNFDLARVKKAEAESYFPSELFYMQYDPPAYKIRAGNFLQRYEADRFVRQAMEKGFAESWAVPERVFKQPAPPQH